MGETKLSSKQSEDVKSRHLYLDIRLTIIWNIKKLNPHRNCFVGLIFIL